jgi:hypothetical protein
MAGEDYRRALGYSADEQKRVEKSELAFAESEPIRVAFGFNVYSSANSWLSRLRLCAVGPS